MWSREGFRFFLLTVLCAVAACSLERQPSLGASQDPVSSCEDEQPDNCEDNEGDAALDSGADASHMLCSCGTTDCIRAGCGNLPDGEACSAADQCASNYCEGGLCCAGGTCCDDTRTCPGLGTVNTVCTDASRCQGERGEVVCLDFSCATVAGVPDDTACAGDSEALTCGAYRSVYCTGEETQELPVCPTSCDSADACDDGAQCLDCECVAIVADGGRCEASEECASGYCDSGLCCAGGDCCLAATDCPNLYREAATCDSATTCQGTRVDAVCKDFQCTQGNPIADDRACGSDVVRNDCGFGADLRCNGQRDQQELVACETPCSDDTQCDSNAYCDGGTCRRALEDGNACSRAAMCRGGRCENGFCCAAGDCCKQAADCPSDVYLQQTCTNPVSCDGERTDPVCDANFRCQLGSTKVDDDSICAGQTALGCGNLRDVVCTDAVEQTPSCAFECTEAADCDDGLSCESGACN